MRVVTTCHHAGFKQYGHRWLESRKNWPEGTEFLFYPEGFKADCPGKDMLSMRDFIEWKSSYAHYKPPNWRWDIVRFAHKVFALNDALRDYDGIGVWLDADCVTFDKIPEGLVEEQVKDDYIALYERTGHYPETGFWVVNCGHPQHKDFLTWWMRLYWSGNFTRLPEWHDCTTLQAAIKRFTAKGLITVKNLSGDFHLDMHPQAHAEPFCRYIDHCKGTRKDKGVSAENAHRKAA